MLYLSLPTKVDWFFEGMPEERALTLEEPFEFSDLVSRISDDAFIDSPDTENCRDRPGDRFGYGSKRLIWRVTISPLLLDRLFNSRFGLRAIYWASPHAGWFATRSLLMALKEKAYVSCGGQPTSLAIASYCGASAKLWPDECDRSFTPRYLKVPRWESVEGRKPQYSWTPDHGYLILKGAFVFEDPSSREYVPPIKRCRESEIHLTGFS